MSNIYKISKETTRYKDVTEWITKLDRGLTKSEEQALRAWMAARPENAEQLMQVAKIWDKMSALSRLSDLFPEPKIQSVWRPRLALAATVFLALVGGMWGSSLISDESTEPVNRTQGVARSAEAIYETAIGEQSTVVLSDGSHFVLNTNSLLKVRYTPHHRILTLLRGEVHIEVATDLTRPLSIIVGDNIVQAVGTAFGVEIINEKNIQVVVTEGKVLIAMRPTSADALDHMTVPVLPTSSITVAQGEEINLSAPEAHVEAVSPEEIEVRLSWRDGNLIFRGETLENAMNEVERYTTVEFIFLHDSLKHEVISGRFKAGDVEACLRCCVRILELLTNVPMTDVFC